MRNQLYSISASLLLFCGLPSGASALAHDLPEDHPFNHATPVSDTELAQHRGGFLAPGGLQIDFVLTSRTLIDGTLQRNVSFDSNSLRNIDLADLMQVIQIGPQNQLAQLETLQNDPAVLTLIQNSLDESIIQNLSILDVTVHNFSEFQRNHVLNNLSPTDGLR